MNFFEICSKSNGLQRSRKPFQISINPKLLEQNYFRIKL